MTHTKSKRIDSINSQKIAENVESDRQMIFQNISVLAPATNFKISVKKYSYTYTFVPKVNENEKNAQLTSGLSGTLIS